MKAFDLIVVNIFQKRDDSFKNDQLRSKILILRLYRDLSTFIQERENLYIGHYISLNSIYKYRKWDTSSS